MKSIKYLALMGFGTIICGTIGMLIAFIGFISAFINMSSGMQSQDFGWPDFTLFIIGFSIAFISAAATAIIRAILGAIIVIKGYKIGRHGFISYFAEIIREANCSANTPHHY